MKQEAPRGLKIFLVVFALLKVLGWILALWLAYKGISWLGQKIAPPAPEPMMAPTVSAVVTPEAAVISPTPWLIPTLPVNPWQIEPDFEALIADAMLGATIPQTCEFDGPYYGPVWFYSDRPIPERAVYLHWQRISDSWLCGTVLTYTYANPLVTHLMWQKLVEALPDAWVSDHFWDAEQLAYATGHGCDEYGICWAGTVMASEGVVIMVTTYNANAITAMDERDAYWDQYIYLLQQALAGP